MSRKLLAAVYEKTNGHCWYCGVEIKPFSNWEVDHQMPRSKGGSDEAWNLVAACRPCNSRKSNRDLGEYEEFLINELTQRIQIAMGYTAKLRGPDIETVYNHLLEASRYLYDTSLVFWGDGHITEGEWSETAEARTEAMVITPDEEAPVQ